jgi:hypothetical protein
MHVLLTGICLHLGKAWHQQRFTTAGQWIKFAANSLTSHGAGGYLQVLGNNTQQQIQPPDDCPVHALGL